MYLHQQSILSCIRIFFHLLSSDYIIEDVAQWQGRRTYFDRFESQHLSGAGSSPTGSTSQDLNSQKLHY